MNNKYDVKNFSDLIDNFNIKTEMESIKNHILQKVQEGKVDTRQTIFDPVIDRADLTKTEYKYTEYIPKRYDIKTLLDKDDKHLIVPPPINMKDY